MKKIFVWGYFNALHPGHIRLFKYARSLGDQLVVGVNKESDSQGGESLPASLRLEAVLGLKFVDEAFIINNSVEEEILKLKPYAVVKGKEFEYMHNREREVINKIGAKLFFNSGQSELSINSLNGSLSKDSLETIKVPVDFLKRHNIKKNYLSTIVNSFSNKKVMVIGDVIVDQYITCEALGMSQEDPSIVVSPVDKETFLGGAGIVAAHAASLGANVQCLTIVGDDEHKLFVEERLRLFEVTPNLFEDESRPTTLKQRFRCKSKTLLRVSTLSQNSIENSIQNRLYKDFLKNIASTDLLILSDFNYGCLPQKLVNKICREAKKFKVTIVADSQSSSQVGDVARFKNTDLLTPTEREARISIKNQVDGIPVISEKLLKEAKSKALFLKLGEDGLFMYLKKDEAGASQDTLKALNNFPKDVAGAGDSMLTAAGLTLASGGDIWSAGAIGSVAAALQVSKIGNNPINKKQLLEAILR